MVKKIVTSFRWDRELIDALKRYSSDNRMSANSVVWVIVAEFLRQRGYYTADHLKAKE